MSKTQTAQSQHASQTPTLQAPAHRPLPPESNQSLNARALRSELQPWVSWPAPPTAAEPQPPAGYFSLQNGQLPSTAAEFYKTQGYLVLQSGLSGQEVQALREEALAICRAERGDVPGFLPGQPGESDDDVMRRYLCIHFPHKISPLAFDYLAHPSIVKTLTQTVSPNVKCMQSMLFIKASGKPGQAWHQDEIYIPTRDRSLTGAWIALDDATVENGCLWVIPRSHAPGVLYLQEEHLDPRFDCSEEARGYPWSDDEAIPVEVKAGSIVFFNGYLLHRSLPNRATAGYRRSLVNHYMSAESFLPWFWTGNLPTGNIATADNRDIVIVAGKDPYAFKGTEQLAAAHVRPSGEGGCGNSNRNTEALDPALDPTKNPTGGSSPEPRPSP